MKNYLLSLLVVLAGLGSTTVRADGGASTAIVGNATNTCWDVQDFSTADGAVIQNYPCTGTSNQAWQFQVYGYNGGEPLARIVNVGSGMCASLESLNPGSGATGLRQHICNVNDPAQQWQIGGALKITVVQQGNSFSFLSPSGGRRIVSVGTHWCVTAQAGVSRPYQRGDCGNASDSTTLFQMINP